MNMFGLRKLRSLLLAALMLLGAPGVALAQGLPPKVQAVMIKKILLFDRTLGDKARLAVVYPDQKSAADELVTLFREVGLEATAVKVTELDKADRFNVVYLLPGTQKDAKDFVVRQRALSVSGLHSDAQKGDVCVAVDTLNGKPSISVHLPLVRSQGHDLSSELLQFANIIR